MSATRRMLRCMSREDATIFRPVADVKNSGGQMATRTTTKAGDAPPTKRGLSRRQMLGEGSALLAGALVSGAAAEPALAETAGANLANVPPNVPEWMKAPGDPMGSQLYG